MMCFQCPPCRGFTPKLVDTYNSVKAANKNLEIVFVSSDRAEPSFNEYFAEMPWYSIPYQDPRGAELKTYFGIGGLFTSTILCYIQYYQCSNHLSELS